MVIRDEIRIPVVSVWDAIPNRLPYYLDACRGFKAHHIAVSHVFGHIDAAQVLHECTHIDHVFTAVIKTEHFRRDIVSPCHTHGLFNRQLVGYKLSHNMRDLIFCGVETGYGCIHHPNQLVMPGRKKRALELSLSAPSA